MSDTPSIKWGLRFGALCPPIIEQITEQGLGISARLVAHYQKDVDAIIRLTVRGVITDGEAHRAKTRLMKRIAKDVE